MSTTLSAAHPGLVVVLFQILKSIAQRKKRKAEALKNLANEQFRDLKSTHKLFIELLNELSDIPRQLKRLDSYDEQKSRMLIVNTILDVEKRREERRDWRINFSETTHVYSEKLIKEKGVLLLIDSDILASFRRLMFSCDEYFRTDGKYLHALGLAVTGVKSSLIVMEIKATGSDIFTVDAMTAANEIHGIATECTKIARERWKKVAYQYALFNKCLKESGLVDW